MGRRKGTLSDCKGHGEYPMPLSVVIAKIAILCYNVCQNGGHNEYLSDKTT